MAKTAAEEHPSKELNVYNHNIYGEVNTTGQIKISKILK